MPGPALDFDIDRYLNRVVPRSRVALLPKPVSRFLGHRDEPPKPIGSIVVWLWALVGGFVGILVIEAVFRTERLKSDGAPIIIASLGAAAVLEYNTIDSPLAQPRNALLGQVFSALLGVSITKLFQLSPNYADLRWVAGALSVGLASAVMSITKTVHPPAGATALLASTSPEIERLGWFLVPLVTLGAVLMLAVACVLNNIQRRFPIYWWTPVDLARKTPAEEEEEEEKKKKNKKNSDVELGVAAPPPRGVRGNEVSGFNHGDFVKGDDEARIVIEGGRIVVPGWVALGLEQRAVLEVLRGKLEEGGRELARAGSQESEQTHFDDASSARHT